MAKIEVPMPQMGESIAEGTVSRWLKQPGEAVERDEPILEISTDKVDAEIPAPAAGTLVDVQVQEGETVEVGTVVAFIWAKAKVCWGTTSVSLPPIVKSQKLGLSRIWDWFITILTRPFRIAISRVERKYMPWTELI